MHKDLKRKDNIDRSHVSKNERGRELARFKDCLYALMQKGWENIQKKKD